MDWYAERNKKIYSAFRNNIPIVEIAKRWRLDSYTVYTIIKNAEKGYWHFKKINNSARYGGKKEK